MKRSGIVAAGLLAFGLLASPVAHATWQEPVPGTQQPSDIGRDASMADIGGVPYVAWDEVHGNSGEVFVAKLNATGTGWDKVGGPVNYDASHGADDPAITSVGGVPYVAFEEGNGSNSVLRVARLSSAGHWEEPWRNVDATHGGIDYDPSADGQYPTLTSVGGVPYVGWQEIDSNHTVARVARLDTSSQPPTWVEPWTGVSASSGGFQTSAANLPVVAGVAGTPYVAWREGVSGTTRYTLRVARLNAGNLTWEQPWTGVTATSGGISDPNSDSSYFLENRPSLASINNFPYVAWADSDGTHSNARVARLDTSTFPAPTWKQEASGVTSADGRIVQSTTDGVFSVSLTSVNAGPFGLGVPYVAWVEYQSVGPNQVFELRAARFDTTAHAWQQAWPGASPSFGGIGETGTTSERFPDLVSVGGVPYLSRQLYPTGGLRISRLEPEITSESAAPAATGGGETFGATAHTYGIAYPFGFQYGPALDTQTSTQPATGGSDTVTVTRSVPALRPNTTYEYRAFATAGAAAPLVLGPTLTLRTNAAGTGTSSGTGSSSANLASVLRERLKPSRFRAAPRGPSARSAAAKRYGTVVTYTVDRASTLTFTVSKRRKARNGRTKLVKLHGSFSRRGKAGVNKFRFTGRLAHKRLAPGRYVLTATPVSGRLKGPSRSVSFRIVR